MNCWHPEKLRTKNWRGAVICGQCDKPVRGKGSGISKYNVDTRLNKLAGAPRGSKLERAVYGRFELMERVGYVYDLKQQVRVDLGDGIYWNVDFSYRYKRGPFAGQLRFVEAKGVETEGYRIKKKLWKSRGKGALEIWKGTWQNPQLVETVRPE